MIPSVTVTHTQFHRVFGMTPGPRKRLWTEEPLQRKVPNSGSWHVDIAWHGHAGYIFLIPSQEWTESWILAGHSSREPAGPVGTYRSASHPDENLRWSMLRSAVSTDVFGCVAALCMGTIWDYDTPWTGIHLQAAICFILRFSNRFNYSFWQRLLAQNTLVWALVSTMFHLKCFIRVWVRPSANPLIQREYDDMGIWITWI